MPARSQGNPHAQREKSRLVENDVRRWVFAYNMGPDVETLVRKWLITRLDNFHCDLQVMYIPRLSSPIRARTHIVLNNAPLPCAMHRGDEAVAVDAQGMKPTEAVKAIVEATGLNPHMSVCGWPFCLDELDDTGGVR